MILASVIVACAGLASARTIANPGCYATSVLLPLIPLLRAGVIAPDDVVVDAKSGVTGAGRAPREDLLFGEVSDDFSAWYLMYGPEGGE